MDYLRKLGNFFWKNSEDDEATPSSSNATRNASTPAIDTENRREPLMLDVPPGHQGKVQGLDWFSSSLQEDGDGDIADEFLVEPDSTRDKVSETEPGNMYQKLGTTLSKRQGTQPALGGGMLSVNCGNVTISKTSS